MARLGETARQVAIAMRQTVSCFETQVLLMDYGQDIGYFLDTTALLFVFNQVAGRSQEAIQDVRYLRCFFDGFVEQNLHVLVGRAWTTVTSDVHDTGVFGRQSELPANRVVCERMKGRVKGIKGGGR